MADTITAEERALIDAKLAKDGVTQCPPCTYSVDMSQGVDWKTQTRTSYNNFQRAKRFRKPDPAIKARRDDVLRLHGAGRTVAEIASDLNIPKTTVYADANTLGLHFGQPGKKKTEERKRQVSDLIGQGLSKSEISDRLGIAESTVKRYATELGLSLARKVKPKKKLSRDEKAEKKRAAVRDRRRFKTTPVPVGKPSKSAPDDIRGTLFRDKVIEPTGEVSVLKDGANSCKIGGDVLVGWLKGAKIFTLTLEERATCPTDCSLWKQCYGNGMQHAQRFKHGPELMDRISAELDAHCAEHDKVLIRLHVLGDFWSTDYLEFWANQLDKHDNLHLFGFSAWRPDTKIGLGIAWLRDQAPRRFMVRTSGMTGRWGSFTLDFPTELKRIGDAVVCPEQRDAMEGGERKTHCGNCGVCWSSPVPIAFVQH